MLTSLCNQPKGGSQVSANVTKAALWSDDEIVDVLIHAQEAVERSGVPSELRVEAFKVALTLASQVVMSQGPIVTPGHRLQ